MKSSPTFAESGTERGLIDVRLSYKLVRLFSEGLYASPNKAIEELVANSFDAGASNVAVFLPSDFHAQDAAIVVLDDGIGMDADGLKNHWLIGKSFKRDLSTLPKGRNQIGRFGIGKLATYVLANRLTHITRKGAKYYSTSMNYRDVDSIGDDDVEPAKPIQISLRELTSDEAKAAVRKWTDTPDFKRTGLKLFAAGERASWTLAILSDLKDKVHEIRPGTLTWILRTALPLRDDFAIYLNGEKLKSSKAEKGRIKTYVIGKDLKDVPHPAPDLDVSSDKSATDESRRFGLKHPLLGRITGYAETYKDLLTGKSDDIGRSYGFFVYVRDRLINVRDGHFGISPDELRHGTFGRIRVVISIDALDDFLQTDRERIREGPALVATQNILRGIFNRLRSDLTTVDAQEEPGSRLARNMAGSPASISRRPIIAMAKAALDGKVRSRYIALPSATTPKERVALVSALEARALVPEEFVAGLDFKYDATSDDGIAVYDAVTSRLRVNALHPFVGAFFDQFTSSVNGLPLEIFAMAEVLLESSLFQEG